MVCRWTVHGQANAQHSAQQPNRGGSGSNAVRRSPNVNQNRSQQAFRQLPDDARQGQILEEGASEAQRPDSAKTWSKNNGTSAEPQAWRSQAPRRFGAAAAQPAAQRQQPAASVSAACADVLLIRRAHADLAQLQQQAWRLKQHRDRIAVAASPGSSAWPADAGAPRAGVVGGVFRVVDRTGASLDVRSAIAGLECLAACSWRDAPFAAAIMQDRHFGIIMQHLRTGTGASMDQSPIFLAMLLWTVCLIGRPLQNGTLEQRPTRSPRQVRLDGLEPPPLHLLAELPQQMAQLRSAQPRRQTAATDATDAWLRQHTLGKLTAADTDAFAAFMHSERMHCTAEELLQLLAALGRRQAFLPQPPRMVADLVAALLDRMEEAEAAAKAAPGASSALTSPAAAAAQLQRAVAALLALRHQPPPAQLRRLCTLLDAHCAALQDPHEVLYALAKLGVAPSSEQHGDRFVAHLVAACRRRLADADNSALAPINTVWALAAMQMCDLPEFDAIWSAATGANVRGEGNAQQLLHAAMILQANVHPAAAVRVRRVLAERALQLWLAQAVAQTKVSRLHRSVADTLTAMGVGHVVEYITEDGLLSVDLALRPPTPAHAAHAAPATHNSGDGSGAVNSGGNQFATGAGGTSGSWARGTDSSGLVSLLPPPRLKGTSVAATAADSPQLLSLLRLVAGDASAAASADERDAGLAVHLEGELRAAGLPAVALEVDGPQHYAANPPHQPLGATLVRNRLLQARGWQVVAIRAADWRRLRTPQDKQDFLGLTLSEAGVPLQQFPHHGRQQP